MLTIYDLETILAERARGAETAAGRRRLLTEGLLGGQPTTRSILPALPALLAPLFAVFAPRRRGRANHGDTESVFLGALEVKQ